MTPIDTTLRHTFGERLRRHRLNRNLTQGDLARAIGVSKPTIVSLERGEGRIDTLVAVLQAFGLGNRFVELIPDPPPSPVQLAQLAGRTRKRARHPSGQKGLTGQASPAGKKVAGIPGKTTAKANPAPGPTDNPPSPLPEVIGDLEW
jgi:transcriptional regulator with XRE-family HTH domain